MLTIINNSIDERKFGNESSQDAVKRNIEIRLREVRDARRAKATEDITIGDYLQVFARIDALASECYNHKKQEQFLLLGITLSVLSKIGNDHLGLTAQDFTEAKLDPQAYINFVSASKKDSIPSALGRSLPPSSGSHSSGDQYSGQRIYLWSEEMSFLITMMGLVPHKDSVSPPDQTNKPYTEENMTMSAPSTLDAQPACASFTNVIGYQISAGCDQKNYTAKDLADFLNKKIEINRVTATDVADWKTNQNLQKLGDDKELYTAVKLNLIEENASFTNSPSQKERMNQRFDKLFEEAVEFSDFSPADQDDLGIMFGRVVSNLLLRQKFSDQDFAVLVNMHLSDVANQGRVKVTRQDIVDFQSGAKVPEEPLRLRLADVLGLDPDKFVQPVPVVAEAPQKATTPVQEGKLLPLKQVVTDEVKARFAQQVREPLKSIYSEHGVSGLSKNSFLWSTPFASSPDIARERFNNVFGPLRSNGVSESILKPIADSWRAMEKEVTDARTLQAARPQQDNVVDAPKVVPR